MTPLEVRYENNKLEKLCTDEREMRRKRSDIADKLRRRLKALEVAETVDGLPESDPLGHWHPLTANRAGQWAGRLSPNYRLLIRPENPEDGATVITVTVVEISNHYGH